jgi:hypothetical protein
MPVEFTDELRQRLDSTPMDFECNFKELEESFARLVAALGATTAAALEHRTLIAYKNFPGALSRPMHSFTKPCTWRHTSRVDPQHSQSLPENAG